MPEVTLLGLPNVPILLEPSQNQPDASYVPDQYEIVLKFSVSVQFTRFSLSFYAQLAQDIHKHWMKPGYVNVTRLYVCSHSTLHKPASGGRTSNRNPVVLLCYMQ